MPAEKKPRCKMCEKPIRGNPAWEHYDDDAQVMVYLCKACHKKLEK